MYPNRRISIALTSILTCSTLVACSTDPVTVVAPDNDVIESMSSTSAELEPEARSAARSESPACKALREKYSVIRVAADPRVANRYTVQLVTAGVQRRYETTRDFSVTSGNPAIGRVRQVNRTGTPPWFSVTRGPDWRIPVRVEFIVQTTAKENCLRASPMISIR